MRAKENPAVPGIGSGPYGAEPGFANEDCVPEYGLGKEGPGSGVPASLARILYEDPAAMQRLHTMTGEEKARMIKNAVNGMGPKELHDALYRKQNERY